MIQHRPRRKRATINMVQPDDRRSNDFEIPALPKKAFVNPG